MNTQVFLVTSGDYEDYRVERVFSNKEDAELFSERLNQVEKYLQARVEDYPIDAPIDELVDVLSIKLIKDYKSGFTTKEFQNKHWKQTAPESDVIMRSWEYRVSGTDFHKVRKDYDEHLKEYVKERGLEEVQDAIVIYKKEGS